MSQNDRWFSIYNENGELISRDEDISLVDDEERLSEDDEVVLQNAPTQASFASIPEREETVFVDFHNPREKQRTIAKGRDFYITGKFVHSIHSKPFPEDAVLVINIYRDNNGPDGTPLRKCCRSVFCQKKDDKEHLYIEDEYKLLTQFSVKRETELPMTFKEAVRNSCIPDLVFDKVEDSEIQKKGFDKSIGPKSLQWPWNKAYYTDTFFSALIYGGEYGAVIREETAKYNARLEHEAKVNDKTYEKYVRPYPYTKNGYIAEDGTIYGSANPQEITSLDEGEYVVEVSVYSKDTLNNQNPYEFYADKALARGKINIKIGTISDKIMGTFSYPYHLKRLIEKDTTTTQTLMWDPFPGMWINTLVAKGFPEIDPKDKRNKNIVKFRPNQDGELKFGVETDRARVNFNDSVEYRSGTIHFYNYGVMSHSNALISEFPEIYKQAKNGLAPKVISYCYADGEPYLLNKKPIPENESKIVSLTDDVKFLYAELDSSGAIIDGENMQYVNPNVPSITRVPVGEKGIKLKPGYKVGIFGICNLPSKQNFQLRNDILGYIDANLWKSFKFETA